MALEKYRSTKDNNRNPDRPIAMTITARWLRVNRVRMLVMSFVLSPSASLGISSVEGVVEDREDIGFNLYTSSL